MGTNPPLSRKNHKRVKGKLTQPFRYCPYSTQAETDERIPTGEKVEHTTTSGRMVFDIRGGHDGLGWECLDDSCPYYTGAATTAVEITTRYLTTSGGQYIVQNSTKPSPLCSGVRFWES
jgi:hypothetical protein